MSALVPSAKCRRQMWRWLAVAALVGAVPVLFTAGIPEPTATSGATTPPPVAVPHAGGPARTPAPHIQRFARQPRAAAQRPSPSPTAPYRIPSNVDGCDHNYGVAGQCVPWTFPAGTADRCAWLREHGFKRLAVTGVDRHHLDTNRDGTACGAGDS